MKTDRKLDKEKLQQLDSMLEDLQRYKFEKRADGYFIVGPDGYLVSVATEEEAKKWARDLSDAWINGYANGGDDAALEAGEYDNL